MVKLSINRGQREHLLLMLNCEYVIPEEYHACVKDAIKKYKTNNRYSDATIDSMVTKPQSIASSIGLIRDNNLSLFRGIFAEWLACIEYNALKNKGNVLMTIVNPDLTSEADLLHIIKNGTKYEAVPGPDIKSGGSTYVINQWDRIVKGRYDIPMVDVDGILTTEEGLKKLTAKQREKFERLKQMYPKKKPIKSMWSSQDITRLMMDYLKYASDGITPAGPEDKMFVESKENRDRIKEKLFEMQGRVFFQCNWDDFNKRAWAVPNVPDDYLSKMTTDNIERKIREEATKEKLDVSPKNENKVEKNNYDETKSSARINQGRKPKKKGLMNDVIKLLGTDISTDMSLNLRCKIPYDGTGAGEHSDSGLSLFNQFNRKESHKTDAVNYMSNGTNGRSENHNTSYISRDMSLNLWGKTPYDNTGANSGLGLSIGRESRKAYDEGFKNNDTSPTSNDATINVDGHRQRYHTNEGLRWIQKDPYTRSKK